MQSPTPCLCYDNSHSKHIVAFFLLFFPSFFPSFFSFFFSFFFFPSRPNRDKVFTAPQKLSRRCSCCVLLSLKRKKLMGGEKRNHLYQNIEYKLESSFQRKNLKPSVKGAHNWSNIGCSWEGRGDWSTWWNIFGRFC